MGDVVGAVSSVASTALSLAAFIPGPQQPFVAAAAFAVSFLGGFFGAKPKSSRALAPAFTVDAQDRIQLIRSSVAAHKVVYGEAKVSGPLVFAETTGSDQRFLQLVVAFAGHEVQGIVSLFLAVTLSSKATTGASVDGG